jgi:hypothetical protein
MGALWSRDSSVEADADAVFGASAAYARMAADASDAVVTSDIRRAGERWSVADEAAALKNHRVFAMIRWERDVADTSARARVVYIGSVSMYAFSRFSPGGLSALENPYADVRTCTCGDDNRGSTTVVMRAAVATVCISGALEHHRMAARTDAECIDQPAVLGQTKEVICIQVGGKSKHVFYEVCYVPTGALAGDRGASGVHVEVTPSV